MDNKRRNSQHLNPGRRPGVRDAGREKKGFAGLDPSRLGLESPDWLSASTPVCPPELDTASPAPSSWSEHVPSPSVPPEPRTILEGMKVVCICKGIKKSVFWKVLDTGVRSKEEINCLTGAGSGGCQGRRCGPRIVDMLRDLLT